MPYSIVTNWIVPYSNTIKFNCAIFQQSHIEFCPISIQSNPIVPKSIDPDSEFLPNLCSISEFYQFSYFGPCNWAQMQFDNIGIKHKFNLVTLELGTIQFLPVGLRHNLSWQGWKRAQFKLGTPEWGTIELWDIGIRHDSFCDLGIRQNSFCDLGIRHNSI